MVNVIHTSGVGLGMTGRRVRQATLEDSIPVHRLLEGAVLEVGDLEGHLEAGEVLVATEPRVSDSSHRIVGALVLEDSVDDPIDATDTGAGEAGDGEHGDRNGNAREAKHISAIAVHPRQRDRGIGSTLIEAALERADAVTANFDADVRPFYESLGFEIEPLVEGRFRGRKRRSPESERE